MRAAEQIVTAAVLGTEAFKNGVRCAPCLDGDLMQMLAGRKIGETPDGEASSIKIMSVWTENWTMANLRAEI